MVFSWQGWGKEKRKEGGGGGRFNIAKNKKNKRILFQFLMEKSVFFFFAEEGTDMVGKEKGGRSEFLNFRIFFVNFLEHELDGPVLKRAGGV